MGKRPSLTTKPDSTWIPPLTTVELSGGGHPGPEMMNLKAECHSSSHGPAGEGKELLHRYGAGQAEQLLGENHRFLLFRETLHDDT